jgi:integrase
MEGGKMASIRKRTWQKGEETRTAWVADYFDQQGKRHIKTFNTRRAADDWLVKARDEVARGIHTAENSSVTLAEAADLWLTRCELEGLERSTLRQYRNHVDRYLRPRMGREKLARLTTPQVEAFKDRLLGAHSRVMTGKVLASLKAIIGEAQRRGLVAHNVASAVKLGARKRENGKLRVGHDIPSKDEVQALIAAAAGRWRPFVVTAIFTGLRASELRGLTWGDVDFGRRVLHVRQRADMWGTIGAPKSAAGDREVPLAPMVLNTLREWRLACPKGALDLVFPNGRGKVESHANILNRGWHPLQKAAGVVGEDGAPKYGGLHSARHFFASWIIERGFSPKRCQSLLGHSSIQMTFDVYGHLFPSLEDDHAKLAEGEAALLAAK